MRKRDKERFVKKANHLIKSLGAVPGDKGMDWTLHTIAGPLRLCVRQNLSEGPGSVFTRFGNPEQAKKTVGCNPYSGKWNHHYFDPWSVNDALNNLEFELAKVTS